MFNVVFTSPNQSTYYLKGTVFIDDKDRAFKYETKEIAEKAIEFVMKFLKKSQRKFITIQPV